MSRQTSPYRHMFECWYARAERKQGKHDCGPCGESQERRVRTGSGGGARVVVVCRKPS